MRPMSGPTDEAPGEAEDPVPEDPVAPRDPDEAFVLALGFGPDVAARFLARLPGWKRALADLDRRSRAGEEVAVERARFHASVQAEFADLFGIESYDRFAGRYRYLLGPGRPPR